MLENSQIGGDDKERNEPNEMRNDVLSKEVTLHPAELQNLDEFGNEIELELHDYVNLQECQEMMNGLHSSAFDPNVAESNTHQLSQKDSSEKIQSGASLQYQNGVFCMNCRIGNPPNSSHKPPSDKFPNIIGCATTKQIMAMYGNPHTPLLPHFPTNIWSNNSSGSTIRCSGCNNIVPEQNPQSPRKVLDTRGSFGNLAGSDRSMSLSKQRLNCTATKIINPKTCMVGNSNTSNYDNPKSPAMVSSPGSLISCVEY